MFDWDAPLLVFVSVQVHLEVTVCICLLCFLISSRVLCWKAGVFVCPSLATKQGLGCCSTVWGAVLSRLVHTFSSSREKCWREGLLRLWDFNRHFLQWLLDVTLLHLPSDFLFKHRFWTSEATQILLLILCAWLLTELRMNKKINFIHTILWKWAGK